MNLVDVIEGRGPSPSLVLSLVRALPDTSVTTALASGGWDHHGWGHDRHLLASLFDAINQNTRATGNWGKGKAPDFKPWPRPKQKKKRGNNPDEPKKRVTVADLYKKFAGR